MWIFSYWLLPVLSACVWLGMLLGLFVRWETLGAPHYPSMEPDQNIAFISDIGATYLKPLFIAGSAVTTVSFDLAFIAERWLRHVGRLAPNKSWTDKIFAIISIFFAICGAAGLILLSIFDTVRYPRRHNGFLVMFIGGYLLSAVFVCAEYQRLGVHYREHRILRASFWIKLFFIIIEVALAIGFGVTSRNSQRNVAAVLEWVIALIFTFYVLSFIIDLLPSTRVPRGGAVRTSQHQAEMGMANGTSVTHPETRQNGQTVTTDLTADEDGRFYRGQLVGGGTPTPTTAKYPRSQE
ncbi:hypothetical protein FQN54_000705 [Arachnomyces sp. PD_36]|nr:hypothetical protein FQN54_000705 [Arachnomyces sp. PD_36]